MKKPAIPKVASSGNVRVAEGFPGQRLIVVPGEWLHKTRQLPLVKDLQVTHIGHFNRVRGHYVERRKGTDQYVLIYCLAGSGECSLHGQSHAVTAGDVVLLPPGSGHSYGSDAADPWTIFWVHFTGPKASEYAAALAMEKDLPVMHSPRPDALQQAFEETYRHALDGFSETCMLGLATGFARLIGLLRIYASSRSPRARQAEDRILASIRLIQAEPTRDWSLSDLAAGAGMSVPHFSDLFAKQAGIAPKQFLIQQRLQIASALMQDASLTVAQIAARVGYGDPYYFSRLFHKHTGQSPQAYRREIASHRQ